jgi:hypothetical protein
LERHPSRERARGRQADTAAYRLSRSVSTRAPWLILNNSYTCGSGSRSNWLAWNKLLSPEDREKIKAALVKKIGKPPTKAQRAALDCQLWRPLPGLDHSDQAKLVLS